MTTDGGGGMAIFPVIARGVAPWRSQRLPRGVYPEPSEILRYAQDDREKGRNDRLQVAKQYQS